MFGYSEEQIAQFGLTFGVGAFMLYMVFIISTGECQVLDAIQPASLLSWRVESSVARSIQRSVRSFMRS
jgi:hypothetical protein